MTANLRVEKGDIVFIDCVYYLPFWGGVCKIRPFDTKDDSPLRCQLCEAVYGKFRNTENLDAKCKDRLRK
ncbi:MAG: hypothetical protein DRQ47_08225 [Gammaproteobacteria bacterium]|nr:MAG: hypothetical protein DRQ47_08225 [Gammaproteobacteria bacterium]